MFFLLVMWGSFAAISKLVLYNIDSFQVQFYMFGVAVIIMTLILLAKGKMADLLTIQVTDLARLVLYGVPSYLYYFLYLLALKLIPAVEASMLNYLFPIMVVLFAVPIHKEKLDNAKLFSILLGFLGMIIIITNGRFYNIRLTNLPGDLLAIGAAICWGIFSNLGKKNAIDSFISIYVYTVVSFFLAMVMMLAFSSFTVPSLPAGAGLLWLGMSNIVLSYFLWFKILKSVPISMVANLSFITPFVTLLFIALLLGERISLIQLAGLLVIMLGIVLQSTGKAILMKFKQYFQD